VYGALQERDAAIAHVRTLQEQGELAEDKQRAVATEISQYREELAVVSDDLMAMTKEQQILNSELQRATTERDDACAQLREAQSAQSAAEANAKAKQKELDDVVQSSARKTDASCLICTTWSEICDAPRLRSKLTMILSRKRWKERKRPKLRAKRTQPT
jgi:predicted  nucleic acid-binding Zn-ribbon protein